MPSVTLSSGVELTSAKATEAELTKFAEDHAAASKAQKVEPPATDEAGEKVDPATPSAGAESDAGNAEPSGTETPERDDAGRFSKRAKSQDARAEDVPRIKELTRRLREEQAARQALEQKFAEIQPPAKPEPPQPEVGAIPEGFTKPKPQLTSFTNYEDWVEALADWKLEARMYAAEKKRVDTQVTADGQKYIADAKAKYEASAAKFAEAHPEFAEVEWSSVNVSPLLHAAILFDEANGPRHALALAKSESLVAELNLLAEGKPVNMSTVASMQRVLAARVGPAKSAQDDPPSITKARPPIKPVAGTPTVPEVPRSELSTDDYLKVRLPELRKHR